MRSLFRIYEIMRLIKNIWSNKKCIDLRFFQFISFLEYKIHEEIKNLDLFYLEDDKLIVLLNNILTKIEDQKEK
jgi:hypothetical protein